MTASPAAPDLVDSMRLVHDFLAAMNRMDVDAVGALLTDDATWTMLACPSPAATKDERLY
jgi:ketosteroid isomerase-like protein